MGTKRTRKTRAKLVVPEKGFTSPILKWRGEALPNRQCFAMEDREYNYLASKLAWLQHELTLVKPAVDQMSKLTREERLAQLAKVNAVKTLKEAQSKLVDKIGNEVEARAIRLMASLECGDLDADELKSKYNKGSKELKAALVSLGYKP